MNLTEHQIQLVDDYLNEKLTKQEVIAFEKDLEHNDELSAYVEISKQMHASYNKDGWLFADNKDTKDVKAIEEYLKSDEAQEANSFFDKMKSSNTSTTVKRLNSRYKYIAIAASLILLLSIPFFFNSNMSNDELYSDYSDYSNLPSFVIRSDTDENKLSEAERLFKNEQYKDALEIFQTNFSGSKDEGSVYIYKGLSQLELKQYDQADSTFNSLIESDLLDAQKGYWYKALLYLKQNKVEEAKSILNQIVEKSQYNHPKAKALLSDLK